MSIEKFIREEFTDQIPEIPNGNSKEDQRIFVHKNDELNANFREWLETHFEIEERHPMRHIIWEKAFIFGHFLGYQSIYEFYKQFKERLI